MKKYLTRAHQIISTMCAMVERDGASADATNQLAVVGRHDHRRPARVDLAKEVHDFERQVGIEVAGRLIGEDDGRVVHEGARDRDALLLTA